MSGEFVVVGVHPDGGVLSTQVVADSEIQARIQIEAQGYTVIRVKHLRRYARCPRLATARTTESGFMLAMFLRAVAVLLDAGMPLVVALRALTESSQAGKAASTSVATSLLEQLMQGRRLSDAMRSLPQAFPAALIAGVQASEQVGALAGVLLRYAAYVDQVDALKKKISNVLVYPALLTVVGILVVFFLLFFVIPRFANIYADFGGELSVITGLLVDWGRFIQVHGWPLFVAMAAAVGVAGYAMISPSVRAAAWRWVWRSRLLGARVRGYQLSRFYRTVGILLQSGIPMLQALRMATEIVPSALLPQFARFVQQVSEGQGVAEALRNNDLASPVAYQLVRIGERGGDMAVMLERNAVLHDEELAHWMDRTLRVFEPALMGSIGLVIGAIVLIMYYPILELTTSIR